MLSIDKFRIINIVLENETHSWYTVSCDVSTPFWALETGSSSFVSVGHFLPFKKSPVLMF